VLGLPATAKAKSLRVLILGGTGFIGPHFIDALTAGGHKISLFNRGKRDPEVKPGIEQLLGDRNGEIDALKGHDWDVVIDNSGYTPKQVKLTTDLLKEHAPHYIFISSIAVYADFAKAGVDEDYKLAAIGDMPTDKLTGDNYGALKVLCRPWWKRSTANKPISSVPHTFVAPGTTPIDSLTGRSVSRRAAR
jgi:2'-hydroxyisoflavone reductase